MKMKKTVFLVQVGIIAAAYAALTIGVYPLSYGAVQFRFSEALTILAAFTPAAIPGLSIGCFISNIIGPYSWIDAVFGTSATLLAAICSWCARKIMIKGLPVLSAMFPVVFNALIIGLEINIFFLAENQTFTASGFLLSALWVGLGELAVCYVLGLPLYAAIKKTKILNKYINSNEKRDN